MLNPIKTPTQMMLEQAGIPHLAGGKLVRQGIDVLSQFKNQIEQAIQRYTRATGKPPSPEEVKQLEDHLKSLSQPAPQAPQTQARLAQQEPYQSHLVDEYGRPYKPMPHPQTGVLTTPERAKGYSVADQFGGSRANIAAREKLYEKNVNAFPEDEFMSMSNVGRLPSRTYQRSTVPSTEELLARQAAEASEEATGALSRKGPMESYGFEEGPRPAMQPFAERSAALEGPGMEELRGDLSTTLYPGKGVPPGKTPYSATVERVRQEFRARGIEPDEQDILNAIHAEQNPLRHDYTGVNPIGLRPVVDPRSGKIPQEMLDWRQQMRMAGRPEKEVTRSPSDWNPASKRDYLLDTTQETRAPFAREWDINALEDERRKRIPRKAVGGMMQPSPRDMRAQMLVAGQNPMPQPFGQTAQPMQPQPFGQAANPQGLTPQPFGQASQPQGNMQNPQQFSSMMQKMFNTDDVQHFAGGGQVDYGLGRALAQGLSLGWSDEAEAAAKAAMGLGSYQENYDAINQAKKKYEEEYPVRAGAAGFIGQAPYMFAPMLRGAAAAPGLVSRVAGSMPGQFGIGAVGGAGGAEQGERLKGAAIEGTINAAAQPVFESIGKGFKKGKEAYNRWRMPARLRNAQ